MHTKYRLAVVAAGLLLGTSLTGSPPAPDPVEFRTHVIEPKIPGGYAVLTVDINKDGKPDVIGVSQRVQELAWYENPSWERHVIVDGMVAMVNLAAADLDGDGIPEIAVENQFAMVPAKSEGVVWLVRHQGDPRQRWKEERVDQFSTSHHIAWADIDGDGKMELINGPLVGPNGAAPTYDQDTVPIFWYRQGDWRRQTITDSISGILHRVRPVRWDRDRRDEILAASFEGIALYRSTGSGSSLKWERRLLSPGHNQDKAPRLGASDVAVGSHKGRRFLASVEPWHGNEIVAYTEDKSGTWVRHVLVNELVEGHEVAVADFNGDGRDDIVAGDRNAKGATVHVMYAPDDPAGEWHHQRLDPGGIAASGCVTADLNRDRRPDIVCIGSATGNIKWYENLGRTPTSAAR
ncbi:MAG: VCBS repeat-containing protein [Acidobacteria bacterium]|nr:VCBS repeat-containing protein [Acidobacteriota bacterium]